MAKAPKADAAFLSSEETEKQIKELLAAAEPLRALNEDDPKKIPLAAIVDKINVLRNPPLTPVTTEE